MRFHFGSIPESNDFNPEAEGWQTIREPDPKTIQIIGIPVSICLLLLWAFFIIGFGLPHPLDIPFPPPEELFKIFSLGLVMVIPVALFYLFLGILALPKGGLTSNTIIGYCPQKRSLYTHYEGAMSRHRFILVILTPMLLLGVLPLLLMPVYPTVISSLIYISFWGVLISGSNIFGLWLILYNVPGDTVIRNKGWKTYWKFKD
jgi:hypothetical protein